MQVTREYSIIVRALTVVAGSFVLAFTAPAVAQDRGSIVGWGVQVVGGDLSGSFVAVAAGEGRSLGIRGRLAAGDFDGDGDVDMDDFGRFQACVTGPAMPYTPASLLAGCTLYRDANGRIPADFDKDTDVDQEDFGVFQRCYSGPGGLPDPACVD
ncbi:MAG TPA: hypothetical protein PKY77_23940 [Phycisphaerae bacterium]|nr:hypothetical protein [Phycisphaerae bacterium]HSA29812.1 hypothetical protein [Phycisphaerae bacterium]